ncbi:periplasmic heavy metal sensor [Roseovarius aquimarinus]|uniref:Periplasmic heavy metal sensor n=1 Tax=Roseovarius aquimarinus TaxID=1229156 RepID=A0ABW7IAR5_9RHOB
MTTRLDAARRWRLVAIASLALNFALIGLVAGAALSGRGDRQEARWRGSPLIAALPAETRAELRREAREGRSERRARFEALMEVLRAEPFVPEDLRALLQDQRRLGAERAAQGETVLIEALTRMSAEERAGYAERLMQRMRRHGAKE